MNKKIVLTVVLLFIALIVFYYLKPSEMDKFSRIKPNDLVVKVERGTVDRTNPNYCPMPDNLKKVGEYWKSEDGRWVSYTPSSASKISRFSGAQWVGVGVGKIICLYLTNEEVSFPLAVEQKYEQLIIEPNDNEGGWSSLVDNRYRMCKSSSAADCLFFIEQPRKVDNIYSEIKYKRSN